MDELDHAYDSAIREGQPPKIYLICQPNNPTGIVYSRESMKLQINWALNKGLHIISDEIYGLSTFPNVIVTSAAEIMYEKYLEDTSLEGHTDDLTCRYLGDYVHIVGGLSKDWGLSGFRVGALLSHNPKANDGINNLGYFQLVSHYTQWVLTQIFTDTNFVDKYIIENKIRLYNCYHELVKSMKLINVPVTPAQGTLMAWVDFSSYLLPNQTEKELWLELFNGPKILFTTGKSCYGEKPGLFRVVYVWPSVDEDDYTSAMRLLGQRLLAWKDQR